MWRIFLSDLDRALQVLRQSDRAAPFVHREDIQSEQRLLQARAYDQDIPGGIVETFHRGCAEENEGAGRRTREALAPLLT